MSEPPSTSEIHELLADFGAVMLEIQLFEVTLVGVVQVQGDELRGTPDYGAFVEKLFRLTAGQLRQRASIEDHELATLLAHAVTLRNRLVHGWLVYAGMDSVAGTESIADQRRRLQDARRVLKQVRARLDEVWQHGLAATGGPVMTPERVAALWRQRQGGD
jgi:hypothetical protein